VVDQGRVTSRLRKINSPQGHDAFLLQFELVNHYLLNFFREILPDIMDRAGLTNGDGVSLNGVTDGVGKLRKSSVFGESEVEDLTAW
jgi:homoserine O-acetyltransferase